MAQRLGITAPTPTAKATTEPAKPAVSVTLRVIRRLAAKQGSKFTPGSIRKALLGLDNGPNSHEVWHAVRRLAAAHPEAFEHISGHKSLVRQEQSAAVQPEAQS